MLVISVIVCSLVAAAYLFVPEFQDGVASLASDVSVALATGQVGGIGFARRGGGGVGPAATNGSPGSPSQSSNAPGAAGPANSLGSPSSPPMQGPVVGTSPDSPGPGVAAHIMHANRPPQTGPNGSS